MSLPSPPTQGATVNPTDSAEKRSSSPGSEGDDAGMCLAVEAPSDEQQSPTVPQEEETLSSDPAVLAISVEGRTTTRHSATVAPARSAGHRQYSREKLMELRNAPLSKRRPSFLDPAHNKCFVSDPNSVAVSSQGFWDPERWHHDFKRSETPSDSGGLRNEPPPENHNKKRSGDPRERLRKEQDGIVLSPQRRSFNSGCFVPVTQQTSRPGRPDSPLGKNDMGHREMTQCGRRIGSGRIIARDVSWDYRPDKGDGDCPEYGFRANNNSVMRERKDTDRDRDRDRDDNRHDRRSFGRDFDRDKDRHISRNSRYGDRRRISAENKEDEPEWFSGGPTSQNDTIELRGFDDSSTGEPEKSSTSKKKSSPSRRRRNRDRTITFTKESPKGRSTPTPPESAPAAPQSPIKEEQPPPPEKPVEPAMEFNLEDFLKMDTIPELLTNGVGNDVGSTAGSRFSRWFNKETPPVQESRRSSEDRIVNNIIGDLSEPNIVIPGLGDSDNYFAPISPAANTTPIGPTPGGNPVVGTKPITLLEMLHRGKQPAKQPSTADMPPVLKNIEVPGKVLSLEELEARMRQAEGNLQAMNANRSQQTVPMAKPPEDMSAFNRLLAQVSGGQAIPANNGPNPHKMPNSVPMSLMQMLNKSQQEESRVAHVTAQVPVNHHNLLGPMSPGNAPHIPNDLVLKLHQVQQHQQRQQHQHQQQQAELLSKLMGNNVAAGGTGAGGPHRQQQYGMAAHPQEMPGMGGANRELLQRPEAIAILQGLKCGDITPQHLIQQLAANPAMQPRHRELLSAILRQGPVHSPRVASPVPPPQQMMYQQQQLRVSPLPPNAYCVSPILATSPNTLTVHHPAMPQRIPSPRELQAHTQSIMQRALIKKKLEEQQENFRKKQEMRDHSPSVIGTGGGSSGASPAKHMSSPTPLAFTPTSVLRKMTAEKEIDGGAKEMKLLSGELSKGLMSQGRAVTGMRPPVQQQQPQPLQPVPQPWSVSQPPQQLKQPVGRPIVKGNSGYQFLQQQDYGGNPMHMGQQRAGMYHQARPKVQQGAPQQYGMVGGRMVMPQQQAQPQMGRNALHNLQHLHRGDSWHQFLMDQNFENRGGMPVSGRGGLDGELSPTSDQLARWFSPELLAQARAGKLPDMPPASLAQNALSLEELERIQQSAAPVHN